MNHLEINNNFLAAAVVEVVHSILLALTRPFLVITVGIVASQQQPTQLLPRRLEEIRRNSVTPQSNGLAKLDDFCKWESLGSLLPAFFRFCHRQHQHDDECIAKLLASSPISASKHRKSKAPLASNNIAVTEASSILS